MSEVSAVTVCLLVAEISAGVLALVGVASLAGAAWLMWWLSCLGSIVSDSREVKRQERAAERASKRQGEEACRTF